MASKSCKEFFTVKSRTVFKLLRHRVNASSNSATVTFFTVFKMCRHRVNAVLDHPVPPSEAAFNSIDLLQASLPGGNCQCLEN